MDKQLEKFLNSDNWFFIHYASNGFYMGASSAPKISCIIIYNYKNQEVYRFNIEDYLNETSLENAEKLLFEQFSNFLIKRTDIGFIHWNMLSSGFGFTAVQARAKELGINISFPDNEHLFDMAAYVEYLAGKKLSIKQILWFNSLLDDNFIDGKTEAEYFDKMKFTEIFNSVYSKVIGLTLLAEEMRNETFKTEIPFTVPNDGLTKEERIQQARRIAESRENMLNDIYNHNRNILKKAEKAFDEFTEKYFKKLMGN